MRRDELNHPDSTVCHDHVRGCATDCGLLKSKRSWWRWIAASALIALGLVSASLSPATSGSGPLTYDYDGLGRLVAAVDGSGNAAVYQYDAVGNLTQISNNGPTTVAIFSFTPTNGPIGQSVTIYGDGFSTTPGQNTVTFYNGKTALVTGSTLLTLTTSVPSGAAIGPIKVTSPNGTATSTNNFTVTAN